MLQLLRIRNLALMDAVALEFDGGFTAVTGETGAGKSVLLGALSLLAGGRADKSLIRQAADDCEVEAALYFEDPGSIDAMLDSLGLPVCEAGTLLLRRTLSRKRVSQVQINGRLSTVANLEALSEWWIDFHGPGEPQKLFHVKWQLELLDRFARNGTARGAYMAAFHTWRERLDAMATVRERDQLDDDEMALLRNQLERIESAELSEESVETLERDFSRLSQSQRIRELGDSIAGGLGVDEEGVGARMGSLLQEARELGRIDPDAALLAERLESLIIEAADLAGEFEGIARAAAFEEEEAAQIEDRMQRWLDLKRKHGGSVGAVLAKRDELRARLEMQGDMEGTLHRLEVEAVSAREDAAARAVELRKTREQAARKLEKEAARLINLLGFRRAKFAIEIVAESDMREHGDCFCRFLFAPNAGQGLMPLDKIASSGEIARVMLALKAALARVDATPVLVFDEVDSNVGGETAKAVGRELAALGERHQVLCVTHLPQVAALAQRHFVVTKNQSARTTTVAIAPIHAAREERLTELARMLGDRSSDSALRHAAELME